LLLPSRHFELTLHSRELFLDLFALRKLERGFPFVLRLGLLVKDDAASTAEQQNATDNADHDLQALLVLVLGKGGHGHLVLLLSRHGSQAGLMFCLSSGAFNLSVADSLDTRSVFFASLLFARPLFLSGSNASFFGFARGSFRSEPGFVCSASLSLFLGLFFAYAVLFETHQLLQ
jgi:hypothetical protein